MLDQILQFDSDLLMTFQNAFVHDWLTPAVRFVTHLGNGGLVWIAIIAVLLVFGKTRKVAICAAAALLISFIINNLILKNCIARTRPYDAIRGIQLLIERQGDYSFPSGHSAASFAAAMSLFLGYGDKLRRRIGIPALALAVLIAMSRLYVGVHYPSDVLFGALDASFIAWAVYRIRLYIEARKFKPAADPCEERRFSGQAADTDTENIDKAQ